MINPHFADQTLYHDTLTALGIANRALIEDQYVGDWNYLILEAQEMSAGVGGALLVIAVTWTFDQNSYGVTTTFGARARWQNIEYYTLNCNSLADDGFGYWCIPIKAPYVSVEVFRSGAVPVTCNFMAQLSMRNRPVRMTLNNDPIFNYTAPGTPSGTTITQTNERAAIGKAFLSGYVFHNTLNGIVICRLVELDEAGNGEELMYFQTPVGSAANSVHYFPFSIIPLRGRALEVSFQITGGGIGNGKCFVTLFPED